LRVLIIGLLGKKISITEISEKKEIIFFENLVPDFDLNEKILLDRYTDTMIYSYSDLINNTLKSRKFDNHKVGLLVNSSIAFMNLLPIDYNESPDTIRSQILWDLSNYFPQNYKEFIINYYKIRKTNITPNVKDTLLIAIHKVKMEFIKSVFEFCNLNIHITDIDHLSAEKCIKKVYSSDFKNYKNLIIGFKKNRIDLSIIDENTLYYFDYVNTENLNFQDRFLRTLGILYEKNLDLLFEKIFLYGDGNLENVQKLIATVFPDKISIISNPLSVFNYSKIENNIDNFENEGYKYTSLLGLAFKSL
jgi:Tfp pilus assembly PilM family ATPase